MRGSICKVSSIAPGTRVRAVLINPFFSEGEQLLMRIQWLVAETCQSLSLLGSPCHLSHLWGGCCGGGDLPITPGRDGRYRGEILDLLSA